MAGATAIADVGETLVSLLRDRMDHLVDAKEIALASPDSVESGNDLRLTLFLYDVAENSHLKNQKGGLLDDGRREPASLALDLHYLLTAHPAHGGADETAKTADQHRVLGRAMQVFADTPVLRGSTLEGSLEDAEKLQVSMDEEPMDAIVNMWNTFQDQQYRPSVTYVVTPVRIESTRDEQVDRVVESYTWTAQHQTDE